MQPKTPAQADLLATLAPLLPAFAERAPRHDREASFPFANFDALRDCGYLKAPVPIEYGGDGLSLSDILVAQVAIAEADGSTAYSVGMHLMSVGREAAVRSWPEPLRARIFRDVVADGALINSIATEPDLGSPQGGGRPQTTLRPDGPGRWRVDGYKTFSTLAPALTYFLTYVAVEDGSGDIARVAVHRDAAGLRIEETWDALGLRATGSHDVHYQKVAVRDDDILVRQPPRGGSQDRGDFAWFALLVGGASVGVARAARDYAVAFARRRKPAGATDPIAKIPYVREQIARIDADLMAAEALLSEAAAEWDAGLGREAPAIGPKVAAAKLLAVNTAIAVVDRAMRVVGGVSLHRSEPIERYYRDVRGALANPPIEPRGLELIARAALDSP